MIVIFHDLQDAENPLNGLPFENGVSLVAALTSLTHRPPFFCELVGSTGIKILIGLSASWSCVQHSPADGTPPYLMALHGRDGDQGDDLAFLIDDTATPVPSRFGIAKDVLDEIVQDFIETGEPSSTARWEEI
jgi:hypothetical protein